MVIWHCQAWCQRIPILCRPPKNLYEGGLQRDLFLPFIAKLEKACTVHDMNSTTDYRKRSHYRRGLWFAKRPYRPDPTEVLRERFYEMIRNQSIELAPRTLKVQMGRTIKVPQAGERMLASSNCTLSKD